MGLQGLPGSRASSGRLSRYRERDDVSDPRSVHVGPAMILDTATGKHVQPLAADLTPFRLAALLPR